MESLTQTGGVAGAGSLVGAILSFFGFKAQLAETKRRIDRPENDAVFEDRFLEVIRRLDEKLDAIHRDMPKRRDD